MSEQTVQQAPQMGRPSKYTPQTIGKVLGSLQAGLSIDTACEYAGINPDTHYEWVKQYPDYSEKVVAARSYGKLLASKQITDVLQDITREKPKYSEVTRTNTAKWYMEKHERQLYGSQSFMGAKLESDGKGGTTATLIYATDDHIEQLLKQLNNPDTIDGEYANGHTEEDSQTTSRPPEDSTGQLPQVLTSGTQEQDMAGGYDQGGTA